MGDLAGREEWEAREAEVGLEDVVEGLQGLEIGESMLRMARRREVAR